MSPFNQAEVDATMKDIDGTHNYSNLGANAVLGVSMATARAAANSLQIPLYRYLGGSKCYDYMPVPMFNIINRGEHEITLLISKSIWLCQLDLKNFNEGLVVVAWNLRTIKKSYWWYGWVTAVGDEGGFAPNLKSKWRTNSSYYDCYWKSWI